MNAGLARLMAARAKADEVIAAVAEVPESGPLLRVSVTDVKTGEVLASCFVNVETASPPLRIVEDPW